LGIVEAALLGLLQGLTEFLPVSSSGHLVLGKTLLGLPDQDIIFEVTVHFGTLLAVLTVFRDDIIRLIKAFFSLPLGIGTKYRKNPDFRLLVFIAVATLPAVIAGLLFKPQIENAFNDSRLVCIMLIVTALILFSTLFQPRQKKPLGPGNTFLMGCAQALAILPGISRSGSTISTGLLLKVSGDEAARFSFLLSVPAILGATILEAKDVMVAGLSEELYLSLAVGMITSYLSGYIAIETLLGVVRRGKLFWFAPYCLLIGILGLLLL
jgi:undecaprenyl-diphosphatase